MLSICALSLALVLPDVQQPLVEFLKTDSSEYSPAEIQALRSRIEQERDRDDQDARKHEEDWKKALAKTARELDELNKKSSVDTEAATVRRTRLHIEVAALERSLKQSAMDRERRSRGYELQLTKLWLAEHWPPRRVEIQRRVRQGEARDRPHGNVEDAGYRKIVKDPEKDIATGQRAARQMAAGGWLPPELRDDEVQIYVRRMAEQIAVNSDLKVPIHVAVLDSAELKAIALPGGFLYITSGVVSAAQSDSELAGVLSREIARIAARHATRTSAVSWISRLFVPVTQLVGSIFAGGPANPAAYYGIGYGVQGVGGIVGRALAGNDERFQFEADQLGVQYAWKSGYDPAGFVAFLDSIAGKEPQFLTEAPALKERVLRIFGEIEYLPPQKSSASGAAEFERIKHRLAF